MNNTTGKFSPKYFCIGCNKGYPKGAQTEKYGNSTERGERVCRYFYLSELKYENSNWLAFAPVCGDTSDPYEFYEYDLKPETTECICMPCAKRLDLFGISFGIASSNNKLRVVTRKELLRLKPFFGAE